MRENGRYSNNRITWILSSCAVVAMLVGLTGCSRDNPSQSSNPNGVSAPWDQPENITYTAVVSKYALVLGGVNGNGVPDNHTECQLDVTVDDGSDGALVDAEVELRWNASDYPGRIVCFPASGVTWTFSNGVHKLKAYSDANGVAHFGAAGYFDGTIACSGGDASTYRKGRIFVDGTEVTPPSGGWFLVAAADLNDTSGVDEDDEDLLEADIFCGSLYFSRSDLNGSGQTNSADLSILIGIKTAGGSPATCNE